MARKAEEKAEFGGEKGGNRRIAGEAIWRGRKEKGYCVGGGGWLGWDTVENHKER